MLAHIYIFLIVAIFGFTCLAIKRVDYLWSQSYNPFVLVAGATILYSMAPWADNLSQSEPVLQDFLLMQLTAVFGMSCGAIYAHFRHPARAQPNGIAVKPRFGPKSIVFAQIVGIGFFLLSYEYFLGGLKNIFLFGYKEIIGAETSESTWKFLALVLVQYGIPAVLLAAYMTGVRRKLFYVVTAVYVLLMLASGTRNFLIMFTGNLILFSSVLRRRLSYFKLGVASAIALVFLLIIGIYRNFGLGARSEFYGLYSAEGFRVLNPNSQELGTSYSVFRINSADPSWYDWSPGASYLNAILSVVPTFVWPTRPDSVSRKFSTYFAVPGEGLGFSNILEAYLNGGLLLVFLVNFTMIYAVIWIYNRFVVERVTIFGLAFYGNLVFIAFNWNRIDFQTVFKISLIRVVLFYAIAGLLLKIVNVSPTKVGPALRARMSNFRRPLPRGVQ